MEDSRYGSRFLSSPQSIILTKLTNSQNRNQSQNDQGYIHHYGPKQVQILGKNGENETLSMGISNNTLTTLRQQMNHSNHDMVHMLSE